MTNAPIRIVVILAVLTLSGIIITQIFLVNRAVDSVEQQFNHSVQMALGNVVESVCEVTGVDVPTNDPIDQVSSNYFIVRTNNRIDLPALEYHLKAELENHEIEQDFEYGVYDCTTEKMVYGDFVSMTLGREPGEPHQLPELEDYDYYFGVYFPGKTSNLLWGIDWWKYTSLLTLLIVIFFGYALFIILKQKRLSSIQRDFVNNITHEFKTPLATLKVAAEVINEEKGSGDIDRMVKYSEIITSETGRLEEQVNQLLKSALVEESYQIQPEEIELSGLVAELIKRANLTESTLTTNLDHGVVIRADRYLLETAIFNLLDNARKYGGDRIKIDVSSAENNVKVKIWDSGEGIPEADRKSVFKKFYRVSKGDLHDVKGFGLGLYVVKQAVEKMNGKVTLDCNDGCLFEITVPK